MIQKKPQQNILRKTLVVFLLVGFVLPPGITLSAMAQVASSSQQATSSASILSGNASTTLQVVAETSTIPIADTLPTFSAASTTPVFSIPRIFVGTSTIPDLSRVDWDGIVNASGTPVALSSAEGLASIDIPPDIKDLVTKYQADIGAINEKTSLSASEKTEKKLHKKQALAHLIAQNLINKHLLPADYFKLESEGLIESADRLVDITKIHAGTLKTGKSIKAKSVLDSQLVSASKSASSVSSMGGAAKDLQAAQEESAMGSPSMLMLEGEESSSTTAGLDYLTNHQNEDGSWGNATTSFMTTVAVLDALRAFNATGTAYTDGIAWLDSYIADNNDYLAEQARVVAQSGGATTTIEMLAYALDESTGGFVFDRGYRPDPLTTAKALQALYAAGYEDAGDNPNLTVSMALYYLTQAQNFDKQWSAFEGGASSISATGEAIDALLPYIDWTLTGVGTGDIVISDYIESAISSLRNTQNASGTWNN